MLNWLNHFLKILKFKLNFLAEMSMKIRIHFLFQESIKLPLLVIA